MCSYPLQLFLFEKSCHHWLRIALNWGICFKMATTFPNTVKCWRFKRKVNKEKQFYTPRKPDHKKNTADVAKCCSWEMTIRLFQSVLQVSLLSRCNWRNDSGLLTEWRQSSFQHCWYWCFALPLSLFSARGRIGPADGSLCCLTEGEFCQYCRVKYTS